MGFRIINIRSRVKLEHRLNYLVIRGETEKKIHISEINTLILQSTAVSLTASLLAVLVENNVKVIFATRNATPYPNSCRITARTIRPAGLPSR